MNSVVESQRNRVVKKYENQMLEPTFFVPHIEIYFYHLSLSLFTQLFSDRSRAVAFFRQVSKSFEKSISTATSGGSSIRHYASPNLSMDVPTITTSTIPPLTSTIPPPTSTETREEVQVFSTGVRRRG